jgi:hypothetical protein
MKLSRLSMYAASVIAAAGILAGCTGNALQATPTNSGAAGAAFKNGHMTPLAAAHGTMAVGVQKAHSTWITPDKKKKSGALLYISDAGFGTVDIYDYSSGKIGSEAGEISGLEEPQGMCSDKKGDVWLANTEESQVLEYAHGATSPKSTLSTTGFYPAGCAVAKKGGNLAVTNICSAPSCTEGNLMVFTKAKGTPKSYTCSNLYRYYFDAYDKKGNLFVDGENSDGEFGLCELAKGSSTLTDITVSSPPSFPGAVAWDGKYVAIGDQDEAAVDQYTISGGSATKEGTVSFSGWSDVVQFTINKGYLIGPDAGNEAVEVWNYPAGGSPEDTQSGFSEPIGSAVSK